MNPNRRRWLLRIAAVLVLGLIGLLWALGEHSEPLIVENHSGQTILQLKLLLGEQNIAFQDVRENEKVTAQCRARKGDHFTVEGLLADKTRIRVSGILGDSLYFLVLPKGDVVFRPKGKRGR